MINKIVILLLLLPSLSFTAEEKTLAQLQGDLAKIEKKIIVTKNKMKEVKNVTFVPELYFVLAELYVERSRYEYTIARQKSPHEAIADVDFSDSLKSKRQAIEVYQRFTETFPKSTDLDKAYFFMAHEYKEMGNTEEMVKNYLKITKEFPKSPFWEESQFILGDYFLDNKKDPKMAKEFYQKILERPPNPFMPMARYKLGWCLINEEKFHDALITFENVITVDSKIPTETLPDIYKKSDVRRDALSAMVWPYSEEKKYDAYRANALDYFESLSPNRPTLLKVLNKLTKRLMLKEKVDMALPVYFRLIEITNDIETKVEIYDKFYSAFKKSKKQWPLELLPEDLAKTVIRARSSPTLPVGDKIKLEKNFEIYFRDFTTQLQRKAKTTRKAEDYENAIQGYENYLSVFPNSKYAPSILLNIAESSFAIKNYARAGYRFEQLSKKVSGKTIKGIYDSAVQSYALALKNPEKLSKLEQTESREGFRDVGSIFVKSYKGDPANPMILFNIARTYYDERDFEKAVVAFNQFISAFPTHKEVTTAGNMILDCYNQQENYDGLVKAGRQLIANNKITDQQFKKDVNEIIKQAEYRKIQNAGGDPKSRGYAQKLLQFASKYQGSSLGDQALYEAFTSLKSKKDPGAYEPGEQLLLKHGDSRYAKEVVGAMGKMAINTADYRRASKYFEIFARKYPKDASSPGLLKNAAQMREFMGDYKEAVEDYRELGMNENVAKQFITSQDWDAAMRTLSSRGVQGLKGNYWMGLSLYRAGQKLQAKSYLSTAAKSGASTYEEKSMAAHSLYLLANEALKDYQAIQLGGNNEAQMVKVKTTKLTQLANQLNTVISYGNGRWTIAALYDLGRANQEFAQFISQASMPPGLNAGQQAQYKQLVDQQVSQFNQKAKSYFSSCLQNAEKSEVFTGFVKGCQSQGTQAVDESVEEKILAKASESSPSDASEIRKKLLDQPTDTKLLMQLSQSYLRSTDYAMSRLILSRVLELKPGDAAAEAQMGMTMLFMNDLESAKQSFIAALKHNPKEPTALLGLAGMYKQFGFNNKLKNLLGRAKAVAKPQGVLHPWAATL